MSNQYTIVEAIANLQVGTPVTVYLTSGASIAGAVDESPDLCGMLILAIDGRSRICAIDVHQIIAYAFPCSQD